jgi:hypothetical protein
MADDSNVYWYDLIKRSAPKILIKGTAHVNGIAVDGKRKLVFVNQNDDATDTGIVTQYKLFTNFTNIDNPIIIDPKVTPQVVYNGGTINGLVVTELLGVLLIADT